MMNCLVQADRQLRAVIERKITASSDMDDFPPMQLASFYLSARYQVLGWTTRRGLWNASGLSVSMALALQPGDTFFDIGANVGVVTASASYLVKAQGRVHSFEPSSFTLRYLHRRVRCLGLTNVTINEFALGDTPGTAILHEFAENFGGASSLRSGAWPGHKQVRETPVPVRVLDEYIIKQCVGPIRMIKIDVQGAEIEVLHGARRLLASDSSPVLFVEIEQNAQAAFGRSASDLLTDISDWGYEMFSWRDEGLVAVRTERDVPAGGHDDVICLKPNAHRSLYEKLLWLAERRSRK